uniref:Lysine-specific demethylase 3 n=2 Tax=Tetraselmis sp. GSL018 TaxID=582737 RepID=A0A061SCC7_9CHLO
MMRACRERNTRFGADEAEEFVVFECRDWTSMTISESAFFRGYAGATMWCDEDGKAFRPMLKLKDFPTKGHFRDRLQRHYTDFLEVLGSLLPEYTHPEAGPLNLGSRFPSTALAPDLGPKTYIAYGRRPELGEGDNVTKLHLDLSDAVNVLSHVEPDDPDTEGGSDGGATDGAVWDIFRREDTDKLMRFLEEHSNEFFHTSHEEQDGDIRHARRRLSEMGFEHPIHCQRFMLTARHLEKLREEHGVRPWHFVQREGEAVFIPAGCAHQVRNLRSCTKIAVDFVSPESVPQCLKMCEEYRKLTDKEDKLQVKLQVMWSAQWALQQLLRSEQLDPAVIGEDLASSLLDAGTRESLPKRPRKKSSKRPMNSRARAQSAETCSPLEFPSEEEEEPTPPPFLQGATKTA